MEEFFMSRFLQLHLLTAYPPANLNRDDLGRPKTAVMGGAERLRVSSQSLKRTWRTSDVFQQAIENHLGTRTKRLGTRAYERLVEAGVDESDAMEWARNIADAFGALKKEGTEIEQLAHISPGEWAAVDQLVDCLIEERRAPSKEELKLLRTTPDAVDIGLFGRMLAADPVFNVEAACQVAHAISVHRVTIEDDYFTAVDDLNDGSEDVGASHIGETGFASGLFYSYVCIDRDQLISNLGGNTELADLAIEALTRAAIQVAPRGKQNSFASRAYASYVLAEKGNQQPRSLAVSFLRPIDGHEYGGQAVGALQTQRDHFDRTYGACADHRYEIDAFLGEGNLDELCAFLRDQ
jgi:CRISPR system Cascade subunit CasC